jgi:hypothetical protein
MLQKVTKSLFKGKYQYKIVLVSSLASAFRNYDIATTLELLNKAHTTFKSQDPNKPVVSYKKSNVKSEDDFIYAFKLQKQVKKMQDFEIRIEHPWISIYTNNKKDVDAIVKLDSNKIKYISAPDSLIEAGTIIMPKVPYDYRLTIGKTTQSYTAFIEWVEATKKVRLTKSCKKMLTSNRSWGGTYMYIKGDNALLMTKMHLGGAVGKIERVIQSAS